MRGWVRGAAQGAGLGLAGGWLVVHEALRLRRLRQRPDQRLPAGLIVIQIDGLAESVLRRALRERRMPVLARWLRQGSHRIAGWRCSLPSQTSASQAGILYGDNFDIPAFRWYEKESRRLMVSNHPLDAAEIARRHSDGRGLLSGDGTSISNLVAGDAVHSLLTMSSFAESNASLPRRTSTFYGFFLNPFTLSRTLVLMLWELIVELWQGTSQRLRNVRPRVDRGVRTALLRTVSNALLRELNLYLIEHDIIVGAPIVYCDFVGYDEVAHHAGPERSDALRVLWGLDRAIGDLERAASHAPRPYHFVVLSDHGQSQGATFRQRAGLSLPELIGQLGGEEASVHFARGRGEGLGHVSAILSEFIRVPRLLAVTFALVAGHLPRHDYIALTPERGVGGAPPAPFVVCASGNLGLIYFAEQPGRLSLEVIEASYPRLIDGLLAQPAIGFLLVRSEKHGAVVLGRNGRTFLDQAWVEGEDPLLPFGPAAAEALRRLDSFPHSADITVNSMVDPVTGAVAAFEDLVGSHGGLGGEQTRPFLLVPRGWPLEGQPVGAPAIFTLLRGWLAGLQPLSAPSQPGALK